MQSWRCPAFFASWRFVRTPVILLITEILLACNFPQAVGPPRSFFKRTFQQRPPTGIRDHITAADLHRTAPDQHPMRFMTLQHGPHSCQCVRERACCLGWTWPFVPRAEARSSSKVIANPTCASNIDPEVV